MTTRERILAAKDRREERLTVPEWDGIEILLMGMTAAQRAEQIQDLTASGGKPNIRNLYPDAIIACAHDPETREPIFDQADRDELLVKGAAVIERIALRALELSGMAPGAIEAAKKNSEGASDDSTLSLPVN